MKKTGWIALTLAAVLAFTPAAPVMAQEQATATETTGTTTETTEKDGWDSSKTYYYKDGKKVTGLQTIGKKKYYFTSKGKLVKNKKAYKLTVNKKVGYYNIAANGVVTQWTGTAALAAKVLNSQKATTKNIASLKKAFLWSATKIKYVNNTKSGMSTAKAAKYYGDYGFKYLRGDCNTQAYTFYWMAKVLGYSPKVVKGYIPTALKNGKPSAFKAHAWVEIPESKATYVYDPNFNSSSDAKAQRATNKYVGFRFKYGAKGTYWYHNSKKKSLVKK